jgi:hypothetical protein
MVPAGKPTHAVQITQQVLDGAAPAIRLPDLDPDPHHRASTLRYGFPLLTAARAVRLRSASFVRW